MPGNDERSVTVPSHCEAAEGGMSACPEFIEGWQSPDIRVLYKHFIVLFFYMYYFKRCYIVSFII
jgi:hypothetical protein